MITGKAKKLSNNRWMPLSIDIILEDGNRVQAKAASYHLQINKDTQKRQIKKRKLFTKWRAKTA